MYMYMHILYITYFSDFVIAATTFASDGIVVSITRSPGWVPFWNCSWWSAFSHEAECLFLGGIEPFQFLTIRNIPKRINHEKFVTAISGIGRMIIGKPTNGLEGGFTHHHVECLKSLIKDEMANCMELGIKTKTPPFIAKIFHHFCLDTTKIMINKRVFGYNEKSQSFGIVHGYSLFKNIFCIDNDDGFNISSLIPIFKNLRTVVILNRASHKYKESIRLDSIFIDDLYKTIEIIKDISSLSRSFKEIVVIWPLTSIDAFIDEQQNKLEKLGWKAVQKTYEDTFGVHGLIHCLFIHCN